MPGPTLYLHVGFHKTGSTVLQKQVFPNLEGIEYLGRPYREGHFIENIAWSRAGSILVSSETYPGRLLDCYCRERSYLEDQLVGIERLAAIFPNAKIIAGIRENHSWILSCYKHYLKYGGKLALDRFFGLDEGALMKPREFLFAPRVRALQVHFGAANVFVYRQEQLRNDAVGFLASLCEFTQTTFRGQTRLRDDNCGLGVTGAELMRRCSTTFSSTPKLRRVAHRMLSALLRNDTPLDCSLLPESVRTEVAPLYAHDQCEVERLLANPPRRDERRQAS